MNRQNEQHAGDFAVLRTEEFVEVGAVFSVWSSSHALKASVSEFFVDTCITDQLIANRWALWCQCGR